MSHNDYPARKWKKYLSEQVNPELIDLGTFKIKDDLNPIVWEDNDFIKQDIKRNIERIARDFIESLNIDVDIDDIVITGSLANYNWSRFSDIDLHILVDFDQINENHDLVKEMFQRAHTQWNRTHDITINDHQVEIYVQDIDEPHHSTGVYSILSDKWTQKPTRREFTINKEEIRAKSAHLMDDIDEIENLLDSNDFEQAFDDAQRLGEKIRNFRKGGLEKGGEYSSENLSFKVLRRNGYMEKLSNMRNEAYDNMMSLEEETLISEGMAELKAIKEKYKEDPLLSRVVSALEDRDPSGNHKYIAWMMKQIKNSYDASHMGDPDLIDPEPAWRILVHKVGRLGDIVYSFHDLSKKARAWKDSDGRPLSKDINSWKSTEALANDIALAKAAALKAQREKEQKKRQSLLAKEESDVVYDDEEFMVIRPLSAHASC